MKNITSYALCLVLASSVYADPIVIHARISVSPERDSKSRTALISEITSHKEKIVSKELKMSPRAISPVSIEPLSKIFFEINMRAEIKDGIDQLHTALEMLDPISSIAKKAADPSNQRRGFYLAAQENAKELIDQKLSFVETFLNQSTLPDFREVLFYAYKIDKKYIEERPKIKQQLLDFYHGANINSIIPALKGDIERDGGY